MKLIFTETNNCEETVTIFAICHKLNLNDIFSPCDTVTCYNDGICINDDGIARCECQPGFIGLDCSTDSCDHIG